MKGLFSLSAIALIIPLTATSARAADTIIKLGTSGPDTGIHQQFGPSDISKSGEIVGTLIQSDGRIRAYRYRSGKRSLLATPQDQHSEASGINNIGMVSGTFTSIATAQSTPTGWTGRGEIMPINIPSQFAGRATKVNDQQLFVGELSQRGNSCFRDPAGCDTRAFQFGTGTYLPLPSRIETVTDLTVAGLMVGSTFSGGRERAMSLLPGESPFELPGVSNASYSVATAVNSRGQIAGNVAVDTGTILPFFWDQGSIQTLGALSNGYAFANDISEQGAIVGDSELPAAATHHAFLWTRDRGMQDLNTLLPPYSPWILETAKAINSRGEIVGRGRKYGAAADYLLRLAHSKLTPDASTKTKLKSSRGVVRRSPLRFTALLKTSAEAPVEQGKLQLERSLDSGATWQVLDTLETDDQGKVNITIRPTRSARFRVTGPIDDSFLPAFDSDPVSVKVRR